MKEAVMGVYRSRNQVLNMIEARRVKVLELAAELQQLMAEADPQARQRGSVPFRAKVKLVVVADLVEAWLTQAREAPDGP